MRPTWTARCLALSALAAMITLAACGARSALVTPAADAVDAGAPPAERDCPDDCYVGHECCQGGCDGPSVPMPNDCCLCLPGEVSTMECGTPHCGG